MFSQMPMLRCLCSGKEIDGNAMPLLGKMHSTPLPQPLFH